MAQVTKTILVVDDEEKILEVVSSLLETRGFTALCAKTGREALELFERENIALVLLDIMLPDVSGEEVLRAIRRKSRAPVILLTAKAEENDVLEGLTSGADDYIIKPFRLRELYARVEAVLRRSERDIVPLAVRNSYNGGDLTVDFETNTIRKGGETVTLTPTELKIFSALVTYSGKVFTRAELITLALGEEFDGYDRAVDSHIKNLRQKIEEDPRNPVYIRTVHGIGYKFGGE